MNPQWQNYLELMDRFPYLIYARNSLIISLSVIFGTVFSNSLAAYGFARLRMPGKDLIFMMLLSTLMLPGVVLIIPQFVIFQTLKWTNTYYPLIVPAFFGNAFYLFLMRQFFMSVPRELEDAARIDGAGYFRIYSQIILPLSKTVLITVALFTFVATWNDFFGPLIYLSDSQKYTIAVALRYLQGSVRSRPENHLLMAAATLSAIPCILVFFAAQRQFIQGTVITGVKG
jgi:multiple sugar transport system permease protein/sn-glycerol 3-phosphate transport system permease protein